MGAHGPHGIERAAAAAFDFDQAGNGGGRCLEQQGGTARAAMRRDPIIGTRLQRVVLTTFPQSSCASGGVIPAWYGRFMAGSVRRLGALARPGHRLAAAISDLACSATCGWGGN